MGLQKVVTINYTCDRCPARGTVQAIGESPSIPEGWVVVTVHRPTSTGSVGLGSGALCPVCMDWLRAAVKLRQKPKPAERSQT